MENNQTSVGSTIELEVHTEQAFSRLKPDLLSLGCRIWRLYTLE